MLILASNILLAQDNSNWSHKGPFKLGTGAYETGRLDVIVPHPSYGIGSNRTIYAGGCNGGLWFTTNEGTSWTNISTNYMRYSGIGDMAFTSDGAYLYITDRSAFGTNTNRGSGVYKYTVASSSWTEAGTSQSGTLVTPLGETVKNNHLKIHPTDNSTLFLANSAGLYTSTNGGGSWTNTVPGNFENIAFVPNAAATGGYDIYISGFNKIMKSSNKGASYSDIATPSPNNPFTTFTNPYFDVAYAGLDVDGTSKILYFFGLVPGANYFLYKYKIPVSGSPTMTFALQFADSDVTMDRICIAGNKYVAYFGGDRLTKYNFYNSTTYDPVPTTQGNDIALSAGTISQYPKSELKLIHADIHDLKIFDNGTLRKLFLVTDGGFSVNTYTLATPNGVYSNSWTYKNTGLHIASIAGFSGSETDPDVYATGEQDTKGFIFKEDMSKCVAFGVEPRMVLIDREKKLDISGNQTFRLFHNYKLSEGNYYVDQVDFNTTPTRTEGSTNLYECDNSVNYFSPSSTLSQFINLPQSRMYYQDPVRPQNIYNFAGGVWKLDETTQRFGLKFRTGSHFNDPDPLKKDHWQVTVVNSMAVSRSNKNKVYLAADNYYIEATIPSQIYRYFGPDIDNSWGGHNDTDWNLITPDLTAAPFSSLGLSSTQILQTQYSSLVMSDWAENKLWVTVKYNGSTVISSSQPNLKVLMYNNGTWSNYSENIPATETPLTLTYERGSNDGLYLTTDRNIYYRNATKTQWELYNNNSSYQGVPHIFISQSEINYKENTFRVGTYGRGIWKTNLNCISSPLSKDPCNNCNSPTDYFWEGTTVTLANTTLNTNKQFVRAVSSIDLLPNSTYDPAGNPAVSYEFFIHGCGPTQGNSFRTYKDYNLDTEDLEEETEEEISQEMSVYPNPNNGIFTLNVGSSEEKDIYIYDVLGKIVFQKNHVSEKIMDIHITNVPKGVYIVKAIFANETKNVKIVNQ